MTMDIHLVHLPDIPKCSSHNFERKKKIKYWDSTVNHRQGCLHLSVQKQQMQRNTLFYVVGSAVTSAKRQGRKDAFCVFNCCKWKSASFNMFGTWWSRWCASSTAYATRSQSNKKTALILDREESVCSSYQRHRGGLPETPSDLKQGSSHFL